MDDIPEVPARRGRGRPKGARNRATIEREAAEIAGIPEEVPEEEVPEVPEVPEAPPPVPARHVLDVSFESDAILGSPEPMPKRAGPRKAPEPPPVAEVPPPPRKPRAPVRQKRARPPSPARAASVGEAAAVPPRGSPGSVPVDVYSLIKRELASRRRASREEKSREYDSYFAW